MSAATAAAPLLSGFCGYSEQHGRCHGTQPDRHLRCDCSCHQTPAASPAADAAVAPVLISGSGGEHPAVEYDLSDALLHLTGSVTVIDQAICAFDGSEVTLLDLLGQVRRERQHLHQLESTLELRAAKAMTRDLVEWDGGTAERRWGKDRKEWKHDDLVRAVTAAIVPPLAVDPATGEVDRDLAALLHQAVEQYAATNRPSWRVTAVKPLGIDPDEFCHAVAGRPSVAVHLAEEQS